MIWKPFDPPEFRVTARDGDRNEETWITSAESEASLRERLEKMRYTGINVEPYDFGIWKRKAAGAKTKVEKAVEKGEKPDFNDKIWKELKIHLFEIFHGKCAYCESKVRHISSGDVEHYRPKRKPEEAPDNHPGYYWLAYDISNLLPSCESCNRSRGKANHFPVKGDRYAYKPDDIPKETPLLLNPYDEQQWWENANDPKKRKKKKHLEFITREGGADFGMVKGITDEGKTSSDTYNLNRFALVEKRREKQEAVLKDLSAAMSASTVPGGTKETAGALWRKINSGTLEYSEAVLATARTWMDALYVISLPGGNVE